MNQTWKLGTFLIHFFTSLVPCTESSQKISSVLYRTTFMIWLKKITYIASSLWYNKNISKYFFIVKRTKGYFFDIISNWKWLSVEIGYMALLVAFDIPSEFDVLLAACGWCRAAVPPSPPHSTLSLKIVNNDFKPPLWKETEINIFAHSQLKIKIFEVWKKAQVRTSCQETNCRHIFGLNI